VIGGVAGTVDLHDAYAREPAATAKQGDAPVGEPSLLAVIGVVGNHEVAPGECSIYLHLGLRRGPTSTMHGLAGAQQGLRRYARPIRALSADKLAFDQCDTEATFRQRAGTVLTRRTAADDDDVVVARHGCSSISNVAARLNVSIRHDLFLLLLRYQSSSDRKEQLDEGIDDTF